MMSTTATPSHCLVQSLAHCCCKSNHVCIMANHFELGFSAKHPGTGSPAASRRGRNLANHVRLLVGGKGHVGGAKEAGAKLRQGARSLCQIVWCVGGGRAVGLVAGRR